MSNSFFVCYAREDYEYVASFKLELLNTEADLGSIEAKINFEEQKELKTECKVEINSSQD